MPQEDLSVGVTPTNTTPQDLVPGLGARRVINGFLQAQGAGIRVYIRPNDRDYTTIPDGGTYDLQAFRLDLIAVAQSTSGGKAVFQGVVG